MTVSTQRTGLPACVMCGVPVDAQRFDVSGSIDLRPIADMRLGESRVLAKFTLPDRYCGSLEYLMQYTDRWAHDQDYRAHGLAWSVLANGRPLSPYHDLRFILNPWTNFSTPISVRIPENATLEFTIRRVTEVLWDPAANQSVDADPKDLGVVRGRLAGRYWYNEAHGPQIDPCY